MAITVTYNGSSFTIPEVNEQEWGQNVTDYLVALSTGSLEATGGSFTLTGEVDFGATYGLKSVYYKTRTSNIATTGEFRLANADTITWRDVGNTADLELGVGSADGLLAFNSVDLVTISATQTLTNKTLTSPTITGATLSGFTANRAIIADGSGNIAVSAVTDTEISYLDGLTVSAGAVAYTDASGLKITSVGSANDLLISNGTAAPSFASMSSLSISRYNTSETRSAAINMADNIVQRPEIKDYSITEQVISSSSGAITFDYSAAQAFNLTLSENITSVTLSNPPATAKYGEMIILITQGAGAYTMTGFPAGVKWARGSVYEPSTGSGEIDSVVLFTIDGGTTWFGSYAKGYA